MKSSQSQNMNTPNTYPARSLSFRMIFGAAIWSGLALILTWIILSAVFRSSMEDNFDTQLNAVWESLLAAIEDNGSGQILTPIEFIDPRFHSVFSGWYWQVTSPQTALDRTQSIAKSRSLWDEDLVLPSHLEKAGDNLTGFILGPQNQKLRLFVQTTDIEGINQMVTLAVAADRTELEQQITRFNSLLAGAFLFLGFGLILAMIIQVRIGLIPLKKLGFDLNLIRDGQAERLTGLYPSEIAPMVGDLNALMDHNHEVIERARTQVGNLAHALKTPLAVLSHEGDHVEGELAYLVRQQTGLMREQIDRYLARARVAASANVIGARTSVSTSLQDLARTLEKLHVERHVKITVNVQQDLAFRGEREDLEEMLGNLMDNACKWAKAEIMVWAHISQIHSETQIPMIEINIADDGPGLSDTEILEVLKRGTRLDENTPGSGLGLSIVSDMAKLYGGRLALSHAKQGGLRATLQLPAAV